VRRVTGLLMALAVLASLTGVAGAEDNPMAAWPSATDHVLVRLAPGTSAASAVGRDARSVFDRWMRVPVPAGRTAEEMVATFAGRSGVEVAVLDHVIEVAPPDGRALSAAAAVVPDDPYFTYQWHFPPIQAPDAWAESTGDGVVVAVIDSGISQGGEDLDCHTFVSPYNVITRTPGAGAATDDNGHGTHVAGTVAQCTNNGVGVAGLAFDAALMPVKVLDAAGSAFDSDVAAGIEWARSHGADVINLSLGSDCGTTGWPTCSSPIINDAIEVAVADDIVIVAASGNSGQGMVGHPANHPDVIAVGAVDYNLNVTPYSNRGPALAVAAPGGDTMQDANADGFVDGVLQESFVGADWGYWFFDGTSMASPHVAGAVALMRSSHPEANRSEIEAAIQSTALDLGAPGFDPAYGHGLIQVFDAIAYLGPDTVAPNWPGGAVLAAPEIAGTHIKLTWPTAVDDIGVTQYRIYRDGVEVATTASTSATVSGLAPLTSYAFSVRAFDAAGNPSPPLGRTFTTADVVAPAWGPGAAIRVERYEETRLELKWSSAVDDVGVTGYRLRTDGGDVLTTVTSGELVDLTPGSPYPVQVQARDAAGNWSQPLALDVRTARYFEDTYTSVFFDDIRWLSGRDITRGCNPPVNDLFCPDDSVTRGQMAAFLVRALDLGRSDAVDFVDDEGSVFEADIQSLAAAGITRGCNPPANDRFCPNDPVTRGQMAAFLVRALDLGRSDAVDFVDDEGSVFEADIQSLAAAGITRGCNPPANDRFCPNDAVTRGQMAAFLKRGLAG
jgi:chitodextrinase